MRRRAFSVRFNVICHARVWRNNHLHDKSNVACSCGRCYHNPVLPTLPFSREFGLIFVELRVFLKTCGLLVLNEICLFLQISVLRIAFFQIWRHFCCFNALLKTYLACFYENLLNLGLFFRICLPAFLFNFVANFSFCWAFLPTHVGLIFRWNYLFLPCFSNLLACFCKITWHHCHNPKRSSLIVSTHVLSLKAAESFVETSKCTSLKNPDYEMWKEQILSGIGEVPD